MIKGLVAGVWIILCLAAPAMAEVLWSGIPSVKVEASRDTFFRTVITEEEQWSSRVVIEERDGRYYWATRNGVELTYSMSGVYHIFSAPSGYVKIFDITYLPESLLGDDIRSEYIEHVHLGLGTITYFVTIATNPGGEGSQ